MTPLGFCCLPSFVCGIIVAPLLGRTQLRIDPAGRRGVRTSGPRFEARASQPDGAGGSAIRRVVGAWIWTSGAGTDDAVHRIIEAGEGDACSDCWLGIDIHSRFWAWLIVVL